MATVSQSPQHFLTLAHVLPPEIDQTSGWITEWLKRKGRTERLFFLVQPAAFINPEKLLEPEKTACLRGVISIVIVSMDAPPGIVVALVRSSEKHFNGVKQLLENEQVPVYAGDFKSRESVVMFLEEQLDRSLRKSVVRKKVSNRSEEWLDSLVNVSLFLEIKEKDEKQLKHDPAFFDVIKEYRSQQQRKFRIYHEVCLTEIIKLDGNSKLIPQKANCEYSQIENRRCDLLLASAPPESKPLLILELDGPDHEEQYQIKKDEFRDRLLNLAGLPVIRVSVKNPGVRRGLANQPFLPERRMLVEQTEPFIEFLVRNLAEELFSTQVEMPRQTTPKDSWVREEVARRLEEKRKRRSALLNNADKLQIFEQVLGEASEKFQAIDDDLHLDRYLRETNYRMDVDIDYMNRYLGTAAILGDVEARYDENTSSVRAQGFLQLSNGDKQFLETSTFFVRIKWAGTLLESATYLKAILEDSAKMSLFQQAREISKNS